MLYDEEGYEYTVDDFRQLYVPLGYEQADVEEGQVEKEKVQKTKRFYANVASASATCYSTGIRSCKEKKIGGKL